MTLDLNNSNVREVEVSMQEVRDYLDGIDTPNLTEEQLTSYFDEAQGPVFTGECKEYYLVFKVTK